MGSQSKDRRDGCCYLLRWVWDNRERVTGLSTLPATDCSPSPLATTMWWMLTPIGWWRATSTTD